MAIEYQGYEKEGIDIFGIRFAPLWIPLRRRWETFCLFFYLLIGPLMWLLMPPIYFYLIYTSKWWLIFLLTAWSIYDRETPQTGGRKFGSFLRYCCMAVRDYFPSKLVKTADVPAGRNYLIAAFPHGVICFGLISNYIMDQNFKEQFPHLQCKTIALDAFLKMPIAREFFLACGCSASSSRNMYGLLNSEDKNIALVLSVGGAAEAILCEPGTNKIVINDRKGFVKLALKTGSWIIPAYTFGENDVLDMHRSERFTKFQNFVRKYTGIPPMIMKGRGLFQYTFGILPRRRPLTSVVGKPIEIPKIENPTQEQIDEYHAKFKKELIALFENYKEKYDARGKDAELICF